MTAYRVCPLGALRDGTSPPPCAVGRIGSRPFNQRPAVSRRLQVLKDPGLVSDCAEATRRVYAVPHAGLEALRAVDRFCIHALAALSQTPRTPHRNTRRSW